MGNVTDRQTLVRVGRVVFGKEWQKPMSDYLRVDRRTVGRWKDGDKPVRECFDGVPFEDVMRNLLDEHEVRHREQIAAIRVWISENYGRRRTPKQ